ncbi:hypothetical protein [Pleomorphochaeta sp. DL1XJH-081]|jgi:hypothetical protein
MNILIGLNSSGVDNVQAYAIPRLPSPALIQDDSKESCVFVAL